MRSARFPRYNGSRRNGQAPLHRELLLALCLSFDLLVHILDQICRVQALPALFRVLEAIKQVPSVVEFLREFGVTLAIFLT